MVLAGVRAGQQTTQPIRKLIDLGCLVTVDGRFVRMFSIVMSAEAIQSMQMDNIAYREGVSDLRNAISAMGQDIDRPHMKRVSNSVYRDQRGDYAFQRLHYLQLWQSFEEAGRKFLRFHRDDVRYSN